MTEWAKYLDCPCCGDVGAEADADGYFTDGQDLICGCKGHVSCDDETEPDICSDECDIDHHAKPVSTEPKEGGK